MTTIFSNNVKVGDKVRLLKTCDPFTDLNKYEYVGVIYDICHVNLDGGFTQIWCRFTNGHNFAIIPELDDIFEVIA